MCHLSLDQTSSTKLHLIFEFRQNLARLVTSNFDKQHVTFTESRFSNVLCMHNIFRFDIGQNLVPLATHFCKMQQDIHSFVTINLCRILNVGWRAIQSRIRHRTVGAFDFVLIVWPGLYYNSNSKKFWNSTS